VKSILHGHSVEIVMLWNTTAVFWDVMQHLPTFQRPVYPPFSRYFVIFYPEDGSRKFYSNNGRCLPDDRIYFYNLNMQAAGFFQKSL
jgi:hypothetical protein